jgi:type I restriction enzyme, S subunit
MPAVEAETGVINVSELRRFGSVKKGYTPFREGDVLFAKITPCMENGKMAVVPAVKNGLGVGSTEFHVLRPYPEISADYIYYFVSSQRFRYDAEHNMTGAVGQRRVSSAYLENHGVPVAPAKEQKRIVAKIEELFSELDKGIENLKTARAQLTIYRQSVLKHAFEGKLTAKWREEHKNKLESAAGLVARINAEREAQYRKQLIEWKAADKKWEAMGQKGKKPTKPIKPTDVNIIPSKHLPVLPRSWIWIRYGDLCSVVRNGISTKPQGTALTRSAGLPVSSCVRWASPLSPPIRPT